MVLDTRNQRFLDTWCDRLATAAGALLPDSYLLNRCNHLLAKLRPLLPTLGRLGALVCVRSFHWAFFIAKRSLRECGDRRYEYSYS